MANNWESYDGLPSSQKETFYDITCSSNDSGVAIEDPEKHGYIRLRNNSGFSDPDDEEDKEEYAVHIDQRKRCEPYGDHFDECIDVDSSASSESLSYSTGRIESVSKVLYGTSPELERRLEVSHDYDEEHLAQTSSSETSPRDDVDSTSSPVVTERRNRYSRHASSSSQTQQPMSNRNVHAAVDAKIPFPLSNATVGMSAYGQRPVDSSSAPSFSSEQYNYRGFNYNQRVEGNTVRGMAVGSGKAGQVTVEMPEMDDNDVHSFKPGRSLHKTASSSLTRDGSPVLSNLDRRSDSSREMNDLRMRQQGYDNVNYNQSGFDNGSYRPRASYNQQTRDRYPLSQNSGYDNYPGHGSVYTNKYGSTDSLEHQHPGRMTSAVGSSTSDSVNSGTHLNYGPGHSYGTMSPPAEQENERLSQKKRKKMKKVENEKKAWTTTNSDMGKKEINDILKFIGEESAGTDSGKKKKDKNNKKESINGDRKKDRDSAHALSGTKKRETTNGVVKKKQSRQTASDENLPGNHNSQFNASTSEIIQTTSNDRLFSRIILNGSEESLDSSARMTTYSERNIDEAIEQHKSLAKTDDIDKNVLTETSDVNLLSPVHGQRIEELLSSHTIGGQDVGQSSQLVTQTINVSYRIGLEEPFIVEEEFLRVMTPESVEEEFKEVIHKKKKGHTKQPVPEKDNLMTAVNSSSSVPIMTNKPVNKVAAKPKPLTSSLSNHRQASPAPKASECLKERHNLVVETQYDFSEKSFPTLSGDHKPQVATVSPFCSSYAAKVSSSSVLTSQQQTACDVIGDGDHCLDSKPLPSLENSTSSPEADKQMLTADESIVETKNIYAGITDDDEPLEEGKIVSNIEPVQCNLDVSKANEEQQPTCSSSKPAPHCIDQEIVTDNARSIVECLSSPPVTAHPKESKVVKKSTKVVEFVGRSFHENNDTSGANIQFGFGFDPDQTQEADFEFGINKDILSETSLKSQVSPNVALPEAATNKTDSPPVDMLPYLLSSKSASSDNGASYPASLRKVVSMLQKEWNFTMQHLKRGSSGRHNDKKKRVVRWSSDMV